MEKVFQVNYKVYSYESKQYSQCIITAKNIKDAYIKFVAESNAIGFKEAKEELKSFFGSGIWKLESAINSFSPLGSSDLELYEVQEIKKIE